MAETTQRVLRLLTLLQSRPVWTGPELAERLGVTTRSIRRDVERLRDLGYPVHATQGVGGGYQLGAGKELPPLLLDDEEAVAVAVCLRLAAGGSVAGLGEVAVRTFAKLDQLLPNRLRSEVDAVAAATVSLEYVGAQSTPKPLCCWRDPVVPRPWSPSATNGPTARARPAASSPTGWWQQIDVGT